MSTVNPQLIHMLLTGFALLITAGCLAQVFYLKRYFSKENPSKTLINSLRAEVSQFSGELADLQDRFTRFQKREGMRHARAEKTGQQDLLAEAEQLVAEGASGRAGAAGTAKPGTGGADTKKALYDVIRQRRH